MIADGDWDLGVGLETGAFPLVRFTGASSTRHVAEGDGVITFTLALSAASTEVVTATLQASTYMSADMDIAPLTVTFAPGQTTATASLTIFDDDLYEADEVFAIDIVSATNAAVDPAVEGGLNVSRLLAVIDYNDVPAGPLVSFLQPTSTGHIAENGGAFNFTLVLSEASSQTVTATVQASSYRAGDMDTSARTFTFLPGQTSIAGSVAIYDDAQYEPDEIFALDIVSAVNANVDLATQSGRSASQLLGHIDNDDARPALMVRFVGASGVQYFSEGADFIPFTLQLSTASTGTVSVTITPSSYMSQDMNTAPQTIVFQPGQTTATGQVIIYDDNIFEQDEVFAIDITSATNAEIDPSEEGGLRVSKFLAYLTDNDPPGPPPADVTVVGPTSVREGDGSFQVSLRFPNVGVLSGTYSYGFEAGSSTATNGPDVSVPSGSGSFSVAQSPPGEYLIDLGSISIVDDALSEGAETVAITITVPGHTFANGSSTYVHLVTLRDNDPIVGRPDNDLLVGGPDRDVISGRDGDDELRGNGGDDNISGGNGADQLYGGDGDDRLSGGEGDDIIDGGDGIDTVDYSANPLTITVSLANQGDLVTADTAQGWSGLDYLFNIENLYGTHYGDNLTGSDGPNVLSGAGGSDVLIGLGGDDILLGDFGNDILSGGAGEDQLWGGWDNDILSDGGETENRDFLYGGHDSDTYYVTSSFTGPLDVVYEGWEEIQHRGDSSDFDVIHSQGEFFWDYYGVGERLVIDRAEGSQMVGGTNNKTIWGNVGNDVILAYGGSNVIDAGAGTDVIGLGLYGLDESYDGVNTVVMKAGSGIDYVYDFESGVDKIDLTAFNFGITGQHVLDQAVNVDLAGTADDHVYFYLTSAGGVDNFIVFMGLQSSQLQASDFIT